MITIKVLRNPGGKPSYVLTVPISSYEGVSSYCGLIAGRKGPNG